MQSKGTHCDDVTRVAKISLDRSPFTNHMTSTGTNKPLFYKFGTFSSNSLNDLPKISIISESFSRYPERCGPSQRRVCPLNNN